MLAPTVTSEAAADALGDLGDRADFGNLHHYWEDRKPETGGWGANGYGSMDWQRDEKVQVNAPGKNYYVTESGWNTKPGGVSPQTAATYTPRLFTEYFRRREELGVERVYQFELLNLGSPPGQWGLANADGSLRPAGKALKNLIATVKDPGGDFTPGTLDYDLTSPGDGVRSVLLQKRNGDYYLAYWQGASVENPASGAILSPGNSTLTLTLNAGTLLDADVYRFNNNGTRSSFPDQAIAGGSSVELVVGPDLRIVKLDVDQAMPFQPDAGGTFSFEAERYASAALGATDAWTLKYDATASGGAFMRAGPDSGDVFDSGYVQSSPRLDYKVNFPTAGTYEVSVCGRAGGSTTDTSDSMHVGLDGAAVASADRITGFESAFAWSSRTMDGTPARVTVSVAGVHTLNLWMREDGFDADRIRLTPVASAPRVTGVRVAGREVGEDGETVIGLSNARTVSIAFEAAAELTADSLVLTVSGAAAAAEVVAFDYDAAGGTATWTLDRPVATGRVSLSLGGVFTDDGLVRRFGVLPGDADADGRRRRRRGFE